MTLNKDRELGEINDVFGKFILIRYAFSYHLGNLRCATSV